MDLDTLDELQQLSSPVEVAVRIRQDLTEFRQRGSDGKAAMRAAMRAACWEALQRPTMPPDKHPDLVAYLEERGLLRPARRRQRVRIVGSSF
jgi:hypothetical protein